MKKFIKNTAVVLFLTTMIGCNSTPEIESNLGIKGAPDWVNEGTQAVDNNKGRYIYGVAFAAPLNDESLQMSTADSRARAEVAKTISTYVESTLSDYVSNTGGDTQSSIERDIRNTTQTLLNGAKIKGRWKDKKTGNIYSFAQIDMKALDEAITAAEKLSQSFKDYYVEHASTNFQRFLSQ